MIEDTGNVKLDREFRVKLQLTMTGDSLTLARLNGKGRNPHRLDGILVF